MAPAKTRVAFMGRVRFADVYALSDRGMTVALGPSRAPRHPRIRKIEDYGGVWTREWENREGRQKRNAVLAPTCMAVGVAAIAGGVFITREAFPVGRNSSLRAS